MKRMPLDAGLAQPVDPKGAPVLATTIPGDQIPAPAAVDERVRLDLAVALGAISPAVAEAKAARSHDRRSRSRSDAGDRPSDPATGAVNVAEPSARTRRRRCAGRTCSSLTSARTAASSMPATDAPAAVRRPTAIAIASSSSSSSGGIALAGAKPVSPGDPGERVHRVSELAQALDVAPDRPPGHFEAVGQLVAGPVAPAPGASRAAPEVGSRSGSSDFHCPAD